MLVKRREISKVTVIDNEGDDIYIVFYLGDDQDIGQIRFNCFWVKEKIFNGLEWDVEKEKILFLARGYINRCPDEAYVELSSGTLFMLLSGEFE